MLKIISYCFIETFRFQTSWNDWFLGILTLLDGLPASALKLLKTVRAGLCFSNDDL